MKSLKILHLDFARPALFLLSLSAILAALFFGISPVAAQMSVSQNQNADILAEGAAAYSILPPPLSAPSGEAGAVRRSVMQFYQWTLLCDNILADKKQICNVSQAVYDARNVMIFSWSLAASDSGKPFLLLRAAADADTKMPIELVLGSEDKTVAVDFVGCDSKVCIAQTAVGPVLTQAIGQRSKVTVRYRTAGRGAVHFESSFLGLREAVAAIQ